MSLGMGKCMAADVGSEDRGERICRGMVTPCLCRAAAILHLGDPLRSCMLSGYVLACQDKPAPQKQQPRTPALS